MSDIVAEYNVGLQSLQTFKDTGVFPNNIDSFGNFQLVFNNNKTTDGTYYYSNIDILLMSYWQRNLHYRQQKK